MIKHAVPQVAAGAVPVVRDPSHPKSSGEAVQGVHGLAEQDLCGG